MAGFHCNSQYINDGENKTELEHNKETIDSIAAYAECTVYDPNYSGPDDKNFDSKYNEEENKE